MTIGTQLAIAIGDDMKQRYVWQKWATKRNGYSDGFLQLARIAESIGWRGDASLFLSRHAEAEFPAEMAAAFCKLPVRVMVGK